jgi:DNA-binding response OmpR family regulator
MNSLVNSFVSSVGMDDIRLVPKHRVVRVQNRTIELTRTEYQFFSPLLTGAPVTYTDLARNVYSCDVDAKVRLMMDKHVDRIRGKLRGSGIYIYCILGYGYVLLPVIIPDI